MIFRVRSLGYYVGGRLLNLVRHLFVRNFSLIILVILTWFWPSFFCFAVKKHLKLEVKFKGRMQAAIEYMKTIEDFDELVDPRTFARHCLGLEPSHFILQAIRRDEKNKFLRTRSFLHFYL